MSGISKRSTINTGGVNDNYAFIDMWASGPQFGPAGSSNIQNFSGSNSYSQIVGADGLPSVRVQTSANKQWGCGVRWPAAIHYGASGSGKYFVMRWQGNGQVTFPSANVNPQLGMSSNITQVNSQTWKTTTGTVDSYFVFNYDGVAGQCSVMINSTDQDGVGATGLMRNVHLYRKDDETDFLAGKIFRSPYKQMLVNHCPGVIRFMDWHGGVDAKMSRFDQSRSLPGLTNYRNNLTCSPAYGQTSGVNIMTTTSVSATAACPATPTNILHGEVAMMFIGNGIRRGLSKRIYGITKANPGVVTAGAGGGGLDDMTNLTASISGTTLTVTAMSGLPTAPIQVGMTITAPNGTAVYGVVQAYGTAGTTGTGNTGTYSLSVNSGTVTSTTMWGCMYGGTVTASISTTTLTVTALTGGTIKVGATVANSSTGATYGKIQAFGTSGTSGTGGTGTYSLTASNTVSSTTLVCAAHGFVTGDIVTHQATTGMTQIDSRDLTVTVIDASTYSVGIDTSGYSSFAFSTTQSAIIGVTLNIGSRGAYPVVFPQQVDAANFGSSYICDSDCKTFIFDKSVAARKDSSGNWIYGVWMFNDLGNQNTHSGGVPLELLTQLVNEVNAMSPKYTVDMWINIPHLGVSSMDNYTTTAPFTYTSGAGDYTSSANYGVNMVNTIMNGANGYPGLAAPAILHIEYSNETWNSSGGFTETSYLARRGYQRWPASGTGDFASMASLRSVIAFEDIKASAAYSSYPGRIKFIMGGQGTLGTTGLNGSRMDGTSYYLTDPLNTWGNAPAYHYDHFAIAGYWDPGPTWISSNLPSNTTSWLSHAGSPELQEADCANYLLNAVQVSVTGSTETMDQYVTKITNIATKMNGYGGDAIMYEGGWNQAITTLTGSSNPLYAQATLTSGSNQLTGCSSSTVTTIAGLIGSDTVFVYGYGIPAGATVTAASGTTLTLSVNCTQSITIGQYMAATSQNAFLIACQQSYAMGKAQRGFFDSVGAISNAGFPSLYIPYDIRWGHTWPSPYGFTTTEWSGMDQAFTICGLRNNDKRRIKVKT